jgi:hypothetical protein
MSLFLVSADNFLEAISVGAASAAIKISSLLRFCRQRVGSHKKQTEILLWELLQQR